MPFRTCAFPQGFFWHSVSFTHRSFHTQNYSYAERFLHRNTFIQRCFSNTDSPQIHFLQRGLFWQILLHRDSLTHRCFGMLLGRWTFTWVRLDTQFKGGIKPFWNQASIHSHLYVYTQIMLLQRDAFTHTHTSAFTQEGPSHRDGFTQRDNFTKRCLCTQVLLHGDAFNAEMLLHAGALGHRYL